MNVLRENTITLFFHKYDKLLIGAGEAVEVTILDIQTEICNFSLEYLALQPREVIHADPVLLPADSDENVLSLKNLQESSMRTRS